MYRNCVVSSSKILSSPERFQLMKQWSNLKEESFSDNFFRASPSSLVSYCSPWQNPNLDTSGTSKFTLAAKGRGRRIKQRTLLFASRAHLRIKATDCLLTIFAAALISCLLWGNMAFKLVELSDQTWRTCQRKSRTISSLLSKTYREVVPCLAKGENLLQLHGKTKSLCILSQLFLWEMLHSLAFWNAINLTDLFAVFLVSIILLAISWITHWLSWFLY